MAREPLKSIGPADPQANAQTKIILDAIDELQQAVAALSNGLIDFSSRFDRRFPSHSVGTHEADMIRAERLLPLIYIVVEDKAFSCVSLVNAVMEAQHEELAMEIDAFKNNKRLGSFFSRVEGFPTENGFAIKRVTSPGAIPQLWMVQLTKRV